MERISLDRADIDQIAHLVDEALDGEPVLESAEALRRLAVLAQELPRRLRHGLGRFRLEEPIGGAVLISGFAIDQERIGPTPLTFEACRRSRRTIREDAILTMVSSLLGDLVGWATQQSGHLIHEIFPILAHQDMQIGTGCRQLLWWHTEDAFHPLRADYLSLFCLRNPLGTPTTLASLDQICLDEQTVDWLFRREYEILPDESHLGHTGPLPAGLTPITVNVPPASGVGDSEKVAVFFGERNRPYLRLDPYFMPRPVEPAAARSLQRLIDQIDASLQDIVLRPGDLLLVDNFRAVHGRRPFQARFDGTDRWLKRTLIVRDLRKSLESRGSVGSRVIR